MRQVYFSKVGDKVRVLTVGQGVLHLDVSASVTAQPYFDSIEIQSNEYRLIYKRDEILAPTAATLDALVDELCTNYFNRSGALANVPTGTLFGDETVATFRTTKQAFHFAMGLPCHAMRQYGVGTCGLVQSPVGIYDAQFDGVVESELPNTAGNAGMHGVIMTAPNRYIPGHISYFGGTMQWDFSQANGDFDLLVGAIIWGVVPALGDIKEGMMYGFIRRSGVVSFITRIIKNYQIERQTIHTHSFNHEVLTIFEQRIGYYGIHPHMVINVKNEMDYFYRNLEAMDGFQQNTTSVSNPMLAWGLYMKNRGNTGPLTMRFGSLEYGNYVATPEATDPTGRIVTGSFAIASATIDTNDADATAATGLIGAAAVLDSATMVTSITNGVRTFTAIRNTVRNKLLSFVFRAIPQNVNRTVFFNIYIVPATDVVATFTQPEPGYSVLHVAEATAITSFSLANVINTYRYVLQNSTVVAETSPAEPILSPDNVAILTMRVTTGGALAMSDISFNFVAIDEF